MSGIGANTTVDGITGRPVYDYQPPQAFFDIGAPTGDQVFNAADYGVVADPSVNNQPMRG